MREQKARHRKAEKKKGSMLATLCVLTALAFVLSTGAVSLARYAMEQQKEDVAVAAPFYFVSDQLSAKEPLPYTQLPPTDEETVAITFTISNHVDDLRLSQKDIEYICDAYVGSNIVSNAPAQGTLGGGQKVDRTITLNVNKSKFADGPVTVVAKASSPYEKEIRGTFGFAEESAEGLQTVLREENSAVVLEVIGDIGEWDTLTVNWPEGLVYDPDCVYFGNNYAQDANNERREATLLGPISGRCALTFLKTDPNLSYQKSDFTVTLT